MCGISVVIDKNNKNALQILLKSLEILQNRGYDSFGTCFYDSREKNYKIIKKSLNNNLTNIDDTYELFMNDCSIYDSNICIGHTRWATHGSINDNNAHPHISKNKKFTLVHNGIIENYNSLKNRLLSKGYSFYSDTDSEVIVNLIEHFYDSCKNVIDAINETTKILLGTYGLSIIFNEDSDKIYLIRNGSPLLIGENENYIIATSEASGFLNNVKHYYSLEQNTVAILDINCGINNVVLNNKIVNKYDDNIDKGNFEHWTLKEIMEQSESLQRAINYGGRVNKNNIMLGGLSQLKQITEIQNIIFLGCGTSFYASNIACNYIKQTQLFNTVLCIDGSEFNVDDIPNNGNSLIIMCSQSGETKDLHRVFEELKYTNKNTTTMGVINVVDSLIAREVDHGIYMNAGKEIAVASTKSFTSSIIIFKLFSLWCKQHFDFNIKMNTLTDILNVSYQIKNLNSNIDNFINSKIIENLNNNNLFVLGKGNMEYIAKECALKMKEICYIHAEGYSASSLKHGPFALLTNNFPVILLIDKKNRWKMMNTYKEIETRGANIIVLTELDDLEIEEKNTIVLPGNNELQEIIYMVALQHICYKLSILRNINPDKPRNLAKVVTVE
jgi:glucosamine--fructose-6-phosphate aminotransferase (isomerizing)